MQNSKGSSISEGNVRLDGYSFPLCRKIVETMQKRQENFHVRTLCVLGHNTKNDSQGNAYPIFNGFLVSSSFDNSLISKWQMEVQSLVKHYIQFLAAHDSEIAKY